MSGFAGTLGERVMLLARAAGRDDLGGADGTWSEGATVWASVRPDGAAPIDEAGLRPRWIVTIRAEIVAVPERLRWGTLVLAVRRAERDPAHPDRIVLRTEETR